MSIQSVPAVIVGFEANGLGVARALRQANIASIALAGPEWSPPCASRSTKITMASGWSEDAVVGDLISIGRELGAKAPLLITKDEPVLWISAHRDELSNYFAIALPEPDIVALLMDKLRFHALASERGWPLPSSWLVNDRAELAAILNEVSYPCILKPAVKNSEFRSKSPRKAFKALDARELVALYDLVSAWEREVVIQEWIDGGDDRVAFGLGFWNANSEPLALFPGRKLRQYPPECGNTALSERAPAEWRDELVSLTAKILGDVRYRGLGSVEYKVRPDGRLVIMEPTVGRTNYQNEVAVVNGVNLPAIAYYDAAGMRPELERMIDAARRDHRATKLIDTPADYRSARFYIAESRLTWRDWLRSRSGRKRDMLFRLHDPAPAVVSATRAIASFIKHRILKPVLRPLLRSH